MKIARATLQPCRQRLLDPDWKFARATVPELQGWLLRLESDDGVHGLGYAHAIPAITTHGAGAEAALAWLAPQLVGREVADLAGIVEDIDVLLAGQPSVKAAIDMALHDLLARSLGMPLQLLLGGRRRERIAQSRILAIKAPLEMAAKAAELAAQGYRTLKLKLSGDTALDLARIAAVRDAAGPQLRLTLDPNQSYSAKQMMQAFARFERHDIALIEQPVPATDWAGLALLTRSLPVAVEADESAQTVHDVFRLVSERACDVINLKITKLGGLRRFLQAVRVCEAGQVGVRVGAAFGPALLQACGVHAASVVNALPFDCELSEHQHLRDDLFTPLSVVDGQIEVPATPGCGVALAAA
ncbi:MAG: hypothetical protein KBC73_09570 [Burkholderiaceae bacterium]|nr:hypothetical protein [Burkholderiaceae bacterium]